PCIEQNNFTKYLVSENLYVSPRSQCFRICRIACNVFVYGKLRVCGRGFSVGKSEASKRATTKRLN
ncbi:MAG: hypothetical protein COZ17_09255, partial [Flavobacteriaceae bacterium CG_4_10_14_3_um_filter_33_47]